MVTTITLNPCIDMAVRLPQFEPGALNLAGQVEAAFGGKGLNTAFALHELGVPAKCTGILFSGRGYELEAELGQKGILHQFYTMPGSFRTNIKILDQSTEEMTEINAPGDPITMDAVYKAESVILEAVKDSKIIVVSGRMPVGSSPGYIRRLVKLLKQNEAKVIVDTSGEPLFDAVKESPFLIKPNLEEMRQVFGCQSNEMEDILRTCGRIISHGVKVVCVSMGAGGAVIAGHTGYAFFGEAAGAEVQTLFGAGDAMVAGICRAVLEGRDLEGMLECALAAAGAAVSRSGGWSNFEGRYTDLLPDIKVRQVSP